MSTAIRISNQIKSRNTQEWVQNREVGDIVRRGYPNRFYVTENVIGGYADRTDLHHADGWREYKNLVDGVDYDSATQKLNTNLIVGYPIGEPLETRTHYAYKIVDLTAEEIEELVESTDDNDATVKLDLNITEGDELFRKCYKKIWRRRHKDREANNKLTQSEARDLMEWLQPTYLWLKTGNWHQAKREINKNALITLITTANITGITNTYNWFKGEIENYFDNNYDL